MGSSNTSRTVITPQGYHTGKCGYCGSTPTAPPKPPKADEKTARDGDGNLKGSETLVDDDVALKAIETEGNQSYYVSASTLSVEDYQKLLDRGWRRSGKLLYKQNRKASCCPHYTIRLEASKFESRKEQRSTINRWNKFVLGTDYMVQTAAQAARDAAKDPELMKARRAAKRVAVTKGESEDDNELRKSVHASEYDTLKHPPEPSHQFTITIEPSNFSEEKFQLFKKYQVNIHHEKPEKQTHESFKRFLCDTPLMARFGLTAEDIDRKYGSYHQLYRLDGRLIAMAVLDLLPDCVSSVYFMYDTDYQKFSMGKLSACREIVFAQENGYKYYYLGYYIHKNKKMEYKALFSPAELLDPESNTFHPMEDFIPPDGAFEGLNKYRYVSIDQPETSCRLCSADRPGVESHFSFREVGGFGGAFKTLWDRQMPGITPLEHVKELELGDIDIRVNGYNAQAKQLKGFTMADIEEEDSITRHIAEMTAVMGPDVVMDAVLTF